MFKFIKNKLSKIYNQFTSTVNSLFTTKTIDEKTLQKLEKLLISTDPGITTPKKIITNLKEKFNKGQLVEGKDLKKSLEIELLDILNLPNSALEADVYLLVGVNGSGKTTFAGKLANKFTKEDKKVLLVAGDTFRAAAKEQLMEWAEKSNSQIESGGKNQDPASLIYKACQRFLNEGFDKIIIDTAGRLQTKSNLMKELEKIKKVIKKVLLNKKMISLLTIDAMLGQNSFEQAKIFNECIKINGIVLTKLDGTGKGGIVFSIAQELKIPINFISFGEKIDNLEIFNKEEYIKGLLQK